MTGLRSGHPASILLVTSVTIISPAAEAATSFKAEAKILASSWTRGLNNS